MAGQLALAMDQGATLSYYFVWSYRSGGTDENPVYAPYDLTGCTARMQIRAGYGTEILVDATTENSCLIIQLDDEPGRVDIHIPADMTDAVDIKRAKSDLEVVWPSGDVTRVLDIAITNTLNITRDA